MLNTDEEYRKMHIDVISFGFKYGLPENADMVLDARLLNNPYYVTEMRACTGKEKDVSDYVLCNDLGRGFISHTSDMLSFLLPEYVHSGRTHFTLAIGCTGGQHRSVAVAERIGELIAKEGYDVSVAHRDMEASRKAEQSIIACTSGG